MGPEIVALFNTFFHGNISAVERMCLRSFVDFGHYINVFSYDKTVCPDYCNWMDARQIADVSDIYYYEDGPGKGSIAAFANFFRYKLLQNFDGWWVDTDVICLRADWPDGPFVAGWEDENFINNAVMKFEKNHSGLQEMIDFCLQQKGRAEWGATGPQMLTEIYKKYNLLNYVKKFDCFYSINWSEADLFIKPEAKDDILTRTRESYAVHLYNEMFRRKGIDKNKIPPEKSFLWEVAYKHGVINFFNEI